MNTLPPSSPERDAALDAAWSAHSREEPPASLDATILAAAHRAVGSAPRDVTTLVAEATSPQRWWMPLAAAATIGAVALGILQLAPQEPAPSAPVSDTAGTAAMPRDRLAPAERKDAATPNADDGGASAAAKVNSRSATLNEARPSASAPPDAAGARLQGGMRLYGSPLVKQEPAPAADSAQVTSAAPATITRIPPPARDADEMRIQRAEPSATLAKRQAPPVPQAFPAEAERRKTTTADNDGAAIVADRPAPDIAAARSTAVPAPPSANVARGDSGSATGRIVSEATAPAGTPAAAPPAFAPHAANGGGAMPAATPEATGARLQDPDAWIARIRKLYDDGRPQDAAKELVAMRSAFPDADGRLPESMRAWAATVKP